MITTVSISLFYLLIKMETIIKLQNLKKLIIIKLELLKRT